MKQIEEIIYYHNHQINERGLGWKKIKNVFLQKK